MQLKLEINFLIKLIWLLL